MDNIYFPGMDTSNQSQDIYFPGMDTKPTSTTPSVATAQAIQAGADPTDLAKAKQMLGNKDYIGYCQTFVEQETGSGWKGTSATDAWQRQQDQAVQGLQGVQPGDEIYFQDPSNPDGHVGIYAGNNQMVSATDNGVEQTDLGQWVQETGQKPLGYIPIKK